MWENKFQNSENNEVLPLVDNLPVELCVDDHGWPALRLLAASAYSPSFNYTFKIDYWEITSKNTYFTRICGPSIWIIYAFFVEIYMQIQ